MRFCRNQNVLEEETIAYKEIDYNTYCRYVIWTTYTIVLIENSHLDFRVKLVTFQKIVGLLKYIYKPFPEFSIFKNLSLITSLKSGVFTNK